MGAAAASASERRQDAQDFAQAVTGGEPDHGGHRQAWQHCCARIPRQARRLGGALSERAAAVRAPQNVAEDGVALRRYRFTAQRGRIARAPREIGAADELHNAGKSAARERDLLQLPGKLGQDGAEGAFNSDGVTPTSTNAAPLASPCA